MRCYEGVHVDGESFWQSAAEWRASCFPLPSYSALFTLIRQLTAADGRDSDSHTCPKYRLLDASGQVTPDLSEAESGSGLTRQTISDENKPSTRRLGTPFRILASRLVGSNPLSSTRCVGSHVGSNHLKNYCSQKAPRRLPTSSPSERNTLRSTAPQAVAARPL